MTGAAKWSRNNYCCLINLVAANYKQTIHFDQFPKPKYKLAEYFEFT